MSNNNVLIDSDILVTSGIFPFASFLIKCAGSTLCCYNDLVTFLLKTCYHPVISVN